MAIQVKMYEGTLADLHVVEQLRRAHSAYKAHALVLLTTAEAISPEVDQKLQELMAEHEVDVQVWTRSHLTNLILHHLSNNPEPS